MQSIALGLVIPRSVENYNRSLPLRLPFTLRCDWTVRDLGPTLQPLIEDADLDGHPDVFANTLDGSILGVLRADLLDPDVAALADEEPYRWTHFHNRSQYLTNPVTVALPWRAEKTVLFASADGNLDVFDVDGQLLGSVQLPTVYLRRSWFEDAGGPATHPISSYLSWVHKDPRQWLQLTPRILATPLSLPPGLFHDESWPLGRLPLSPLALLVAVTYLPGGSNLAAGEGQSAPEEDVLLAGLYGLTACALVPSAISCSSMRRAVETGLFFLPLELTRLSDRFPAYLLSTPTLGRDILHGSDNFGGLSHRSFFLLSSGSGLLHRLSLEALLRHSLDYWSEAQSADRPVDPHVHTLKLLSPPSECLLVDCPSASDQLCCLLSEAGSGLALLDLRQTPLSAQHRPAGRVVWRFELPVGDGVSPTAAAVTFAVPTLVPSEEPIVLLPDALGNIHAVFLKDGSALPGSPAPNPFRNNRSDACSSVLTPGVAFVDDWLNRYVVFFSNCGRAAAVDIWNNFTIHDVVEEALDSAEVLSSLHAWFDQRQETSHMAASGRRRRDLLVAPSASVKALKGAQRISAAPPGELPEVAFLLPSQEGDMQLFTAFRKNSSFRSMLFSPCVSVHASLRTLDATGLERLSPIPTLTDGTVAGGLLLSVRISDCLSLFPRNSPKGLDLESHPSYIAQILNTEGLPLVPLQTVKCLPAPSATAKMHHSPKLQACEMNFLLDLSHAPLLAAPKGRVTVLIFSPSGRLLVTSSAHLESIIIPVQQDTSISSWLLVFSYLPIVLFMDLGSLLLNLQVFDSSRLEAYSEGTQATPLVLLLSRGSSRHEEVLAALTAHLLSPSPASTQSLQCSTVPSTAADSSFLLLCLYHSARRYQSYLDSFLKRSSVKRSLLAVDMAAELSASLQSRPDTPAEALNCRVDRLIQEFRERVTSSRRQVTGLDYAIIVDDISSLLDLRMTPRQIYQLVDSLGSEACDLLVLGCHLDEFNSEEGLLRLVHLLSRRSVCVIEIKPLVNGYTTSVDGELKISFTPRRVTEVPQPCQIFHYKAEGRVIKCYPPGSSNLIR
ncbi:hypothetical protein AAHC03_022889 [Spirometra sp. Aus1]